MSPYFPNPFRNFGRNINVKVDLSNYATKADIKNISLVDTSSFALKKNLARLKTEIDKLDIDKLVPVPVDLSKLSDVAKNDTVKKTVYDKLVEKVNKIDTSGFALKSKYDTDKSESEKKISDTSGIVKKTDYNAKITEIENEIPGTNGLATNAALTAVENKIPDVSSLVNKTDYNTKISKIETKLTDHNDDKYIATPEFNKLTAENFAARLKQANLVTQTDFDDKLKSLNQKTNSNKGKHLLLKHEFKKLETFDSSYFIDKSHFEEDVTQNNLVFQPMYRYFKRVSGVCSGNYFYFWTSKGLFDENITSDYKLNPELSYFGTKTKAEFDGSCLKQDKISYDYGKVVKIYIVYEISQNVDIGDYSTL